MSEVQPPEQPQQQPAEAPKGIINKAINLVRRGLTALDKKLPTEKPDNKAF